MSTPLSIRCGEIAEIELPYSEVCMHMRVAGKRLPVELLCSGDGNPLDTNLSYAAQIYDEHLQKLGGPVTYGEAGIYRSEGPNGPHFYHY